MSPTARGGRCGSSAVRHRSPSARGRCRRKGRSWSPAAPIATPKPMRSSPGSARRGSPRGRQRPQIRPSRAGHGGPLPPFRPHHGMGYRSRARGARRGGRRRSHRGRRRAALRQARLRQPPLHRPRRVFSLDVPAARRAHRFGCGRVCAGIKAVRWGKRRLGDGRLEGGVAPRPLRPVGRGAAGRLERERRNTWPGGGQPALPHPDSGERQLHPAPAGTGITPTAWRCPTASPEGGNRRGCAGWAASHRSPTAPRTANTTSPSARISTPPRPSPGPHRYRRTGRSPAGSTARYRRPRTRPGRKSGSP